MTRAVSGVCAGSVAVRVVLVARGTGAARCTVVSSATSTATRSEGIASGGAVTGAVVSVRADPGATIGVVLVAVKGGDVVQGHIIHQELYAATTPSRKAITGRTVTADEGNSD